VISYTAVVERADDGGYGTWWDYCKTTAHPASGDSLSRSDNTQVAWSNWALLGRGLRCVRAITARMGASWC
jgi:hypothetical protein